jgi:hypothetical protein
MLDVQKLLEIAPDTKFHIAYRESDDKTSLTRISARLIIELTPSPLVPPQGLPPVDLGNLDR